MSYQIGERVRVIDQHMTGVVVEIFGNRVVIEDDDSEWEWPETRLEFRFSEIETEGV